MSESRIPRIGVERITREERAREIVETHAREMAESAHGAVYVVPGTETSYVVSLSRPACECADFEHRGGECKHLLAAEIVNAKSTTCADCHHRHLRRDLYTVTEDHESLTWFPGDRLCRRCALAHGIL